MNLEKLLRTSILSLSLLFSSPIYSREFDSLSNLINTALPFSELKSGVVDRWEKVKFTLLSGSNQCSGLNKHLIVDFNGNILDIITNSSHPNKYLARKNNQQQINKKRIELARSGKIKHFVLGNRNSRGYPLAFKCSKESVNLIDNGVQAYFRNNLYDSKWKKLNVSKDNPISLRKYLKFVAIPNSNLPEDLSNYLYGIAVFEGGGKKYIKSKKGANGVFQTTRATMKDCGYYQYRTHRFAQAECAVKRLELNFSMVNEKVDSLFSQISSDKREEMKYYLAATGFNIGPYSLPFLLSEEHSLGDSARKHAKRYKKYFRDFSGKDLAFSILLHSYGQKIHPRNKNKIGLDVTLYAINAKASLELLEEYKEENNIPNI